MKAMILAAGFGTRFRPVTHQIPKPMIPLCNRPLLGWALEPLLAAGVTEIVINVHHLPERIEAWLDEELENRCITHVSREAEILGTGGGIRRARRWLDEGESFFVVNADTVQWPPLLELERARKRNDALAALLLRHAPAEDPFTPVGFRDGRVTGFGDEAGPGERLMFSGCQAMSSRILDHLPDREFSALTEDVYIPLLRQGGGRLAGLIHDGLWFDIGTPARYLECSRTILARMIEGGIDAPQDSSTEGERMSLLHRTAAGTGKVSHSVIGAGSIVDGCVEDSVVWSRCVVPSGANVRGSLVADEVSLRAGARAENVVICNRHGFDTDASIQIIGSLAVRPLREDRPFRFEAG